MEKEKQVNWNDSYGTTDFKRYAWYAQTDGMFGDYPGDDVHLDDDYIGFWLVDQQQVGDFLLFLKKTPAIC